MTQANPEIAKRHRVVAPDMVGFGFTEHPANFAYGLDAWVGQALAVRHPRRVRRLVGDFLAA